jgi:hypothetical protein
MVEGEIAAHLQSYKATGVDQIMGYGRFVAPKTLEVQPHDGGWSHDGRANGHAG